MEYTGGVYYLNNDDNISSFLTLVNGAPTSGPSSIFKVYIRGFTKPDKFITIVKYARGTQILEPTEQTVLPSAFQTYNDTRGDFGKDLSSVLPRLLNPTSSGGKRIKRKRYTKNIRRTHRRKKHTRRRATLRRRV